MDCFSLYAVLWVIHAEGGENPVIFEGYEGEVKRRYPRQSEKMDW